MWIIRDTPGRDPGYPLAAAHERPEGGTWDAWVYDSGGMPFLSVHDYPTPGTALSAASREAGSRLMADDWPTPWAPPVRRIGRTRKQPIPYSYQPRTEGADTMTTTTTREAATMTTTTHVLRLRYSTSRGRETYGWNVVTLTDETTGKRFRANGGGYDMVGTVFGDWLAATFPEELQRWADGTPDLDYGAFRRADDSVYLDGACGLEQMRQVGDALGLEVIRTHDRKGNTTGWLVTLPA